VTRDSAVRIT